MTEKIRRMELRRVPHSSIVGDSLQVIDPELGCVAMLAIMVPQPHIDYNTVADAVAKSLLMRSPNGLIVDLPEGFAETCRAKTGRG